MGNDSITAAGDLRVQVVLPKAARSPKRRSPQPENDADSPAEQTPPPGMGKLVDKSA